MVRKDIEVPYDTDDFQTDVIERSRSIPVLVDFWAEWCGPCKMLGPVIEDLADEQEGQAVIAKVNVDEAQELAVRYEIRSIPTLIVFVDGQPVERLQGVQTKADIEQALLAAA